MFYEVAQAYFKALIVFRLSNLSFIYGNLIKIPVTVIRTGWTEEAK
jgi:hypothetical protein